ncbi:hypothetical protein HYU92_06405 [Candidatus Curtissbacteria bacterium]|nr:hypothetical protein [Candidatus Curtissbacteria bacterium]
MLGLLTNKKLQLPIGYLYWLIPILLFILQAIYTFNTLGQIRYEELDESIVNPYWVQNRYVQNGASANLGWHFLLVVTYNIFGFSLFAGKFVRLALVLISLFCQAALLAKYLGAKYAWLPLMTVGLSPTFLYFNTQQTVYGIDLVYFPISLYLVTSLDFSKKSQNLLQSKNFILSIALWSFSMFALMSYPSFVYFLPALAGLFFYKLWNSSNYQSLRSSSSVARTAGLKLLKKLKYPKSLEYLAPALVSFLAPLAAVFAYIKNRSLLIYDENVQSGMFRGAGFLDLNLEVFVTNLKNNLMNLFARASGYYYEVNKVEFSDFYPAVALILTVFAIYQLWKSQKNLRHLLILAMSILFLNVLLAYFTQDPTPGMRRQTGSLAAIYILFVLAWYWAANLAASSIKWLYLTVLALILIHHLIVYPINLMHLSDQSRYKEEVWFKGADDPATVVDFYVTKIQNQNLELVCFDESGGKINCRYNQIFAVVAGSCLWNRLGCREIYGWDLKTKKYVPLTIELFNDYYFGKYGKEVIAT